MAVGPGGRRHSRLVWKPGMLFNVLQRTIWSRENDKKELNPEKSASYNNYKIMPSKFNAKGGDGAVIIAW